MRHRKKGRALNRTRSHRKVLLSNLVTSLFLHEKIRTTTAKAKEARPLAEKMITFAKRGDLHARRIVFRLIRDKDVVRKLFDKLGLRYKDRPGGYTRIIKLGNRLGDNAPMAILELIPESSEKKGGARKRRRRGKKKEAEQVQKVDKATDAGETSEEAPPDEERSGTAKSSEQAEGGEKEPEADAQGEGADETDKGEVEEKKEE